MVDPARDPAAPLLHFLIGVVSAFLGAFLAGLDATHEHSSLAHVPHQLLLAAPLSLLGALLMRESGTRAFLLALGWVVLGLAGTNAVLLLSG